MPNMADIYVELSIILLSVIAVLVLLIIYIVRQTLNQKREYEQKINSHPVDKELWIKRHESDTLIIGADSKLENDSKVANDNEDNDGQNLEQMLTFTPNNVPQSKLVAVDLPAPDFPPPPPTVPKVCTDAMNTCYESSDANEYSEYCVPNFEHIHDVDK